MGVWSIVHLSMVVSAHIYTNKNLSANMKSDVETLSSVVSYRGTEYSRKDWVLVIFGILLI